MIYFLLLFTRAHYLKIAQNKSA